jgi:uncharacterized protein with HEPN domain
MEREIETWLYDIIKAIGEIDSYYEGKPKLFEEFKKDLKTKRAVERNLEIIGEAVNRILQRNSAFQISNSRKIVDTRNRISHGYDAVSDDIIWSIVINHLPLLKQEIEKLLQS